MTKLLAFIASCAAVALVSAGVAAQSPAPAPAAPLAFEVASVKPNNSTDQGGSFGVRPGGQLIVRNNTLRNMVRNAYQLQNFQIVGGPEWFDSDRFDITAKTASGDVPFAEMAAMVQGLFADRFKLVLHRETREIPIYALVMARSDGTRGPQLQASTTDCDAFTTTLSG